ncbi:MAG: urease accessory protein [Nitrospira sp. SB0677_bin_15]|nr:urease accessory protein [Nitrospira sp. SB0667_bin_9]MYD31507.1 urease accessory protein [Nitrospira sp. SB0661_bin_20]MYG40113.1 urease accessory protein [Nitrospira sp. SB0677_bin_15]MYJ22262.1 urease accessory protein [Nitrospira sp. SB0673_bin_12]
MSGILLLGLLIGMQHALEADHVAAVSSLCTGTRSVRRIAVHGAVWGLGHSLTLFIFAGAAVFLDLRFGETLAQTLEGVVGAMLILLGGQVLFRLWRERLHFHTHRHSDGLPHFHVHSHHGENADHDPDRHVHAHANGLPLRTLVVGMVHGLAGSTALVVLTASTVQDPVIGLLYVGLFGLGSIAGMTVLSSALAVPLAWTAQAFTWAHRSLQTVVGLATMGIGTALLIEAGMAFLFYT